MLFGSLGFAQTKSMISSKKIQKALAIKTSSKPSDSISTIANVSEISASPTHQKVAPEVFYIINDKAVDYRTYVEHLQNTPGKK